MKNALEELQNKPRGKRTAIEQCIVDAALLEEAERDGKTELMAQAAYDLQMMGDALQKAKSVFNAGHVYGDLRMAEKYIDAALTLLESK